MASVDVPRVKLGSQGFDVSKLGLGCMGMSGAYGPSKPEHDMIEFIHEAVESGITFLDTADVYGDNELLVGKAIKGIRDKVQLATKFGNVVVNDGSARYYAVKGDPAYVRAACERSLKRLDVDYIDLYYQHRVDSEVPIEITIGEMKKLVEEGKVKYLGMSEASAADIRRAHAVHPITAVQLEWSLWSRDIEEEVIPTCRELGIGIVPYGALGKGFFAGVTPAEMHDTDGRKMWPRFQVENLARNKAFYDRVVAIGAEKKATPGQIALTWLVHQGHDVVPIPGTTKLKNLKENIGALAVKLTAEEVKQIADAVPQNEVMGDRYPEKHMQNTWKHVNSPPLSSWTGTQ